MVAGLKDALAISVGYGSTTVLQSDATIARWGYNDSGEAGNGTTSSVLAPFVMPGLSGVAAVSTGRYHDPCVLLSSGSLMCWGNNSYGQIGNSGQSGDSPTPVAVKW